MAKRARTANVTTAAFGRRLRALRESRGLSITEVAKLASSLANTPAGRVSQARLSQAESGVSVGISLEKLLVLAAVYNKAPDDVIALAPPALRRKLESDLAEWRRAKQPIPQRLRVLPPARQEVEEDLSDAMRALRMRVPLGSEPASASHARRLLIGAVLAPFLERADDELIAALWTPAASTMRIHALASMTVTDPVLRRAVVDAHWHDFVAEISQFLVYEARHGRAMIGLLSHTEVYDLDSEAATFSCRFADAEMHALFGCDGVPGALLLACRWRQAAHILYRRRPATLRELPPPLDPRTGVFEYLANASGPPGLAAPRISPGDAVAFLSTCAAAQPDFFARPLSQLDLAGVRDFFERIPAVEPVWPAVP